KSYEESRWAGVPVCPHCASIKNPYSVKPRGKFQDIPSYRCSESACKLPFTVRTGTIFEGSKVELRKSFQAIYEITTSKKGISSIELGTRIGVSQKTAWLLNHKIRTMLAETQPELLEGMIEVDETFVGGKQKNRHANKRIDYSAGEQDKTPVVGLMQRGGKVITFVANDVTSETLNAIIDKNVSSTAIINTDSFAGYASVKEKYQHFSVNHSAGEYVKKVGDTKFHTQNIENFWSQLKRGYVGIYHYMSPQHLQRYCLEFGFRYNNRKVSNLERFNEVVRKSGTPRITYNELTGKHIIEYRTGEGIASGIPNEPTGYEFLEEINPDDVPTA
ncbi:MAG: IS1595 family transposase, partial [Chitinophagaceae bacterium]